MRTILSFLLFSVFMGTRLCAQETPLPDLDTIRMDRAGERFYLADKRLRPGELQSLLQAYPSSNAELLQYKKRATPGTILLLTGITAGVIAFTRLKKDEQFFTPYTITLFLGDAIGIPLMISAKKHLRRSVKLYNTELLLRSR